MITIETELPKCYSKARIQNINEPLKNTKPLLLPYCLSRSRSRSRSTTTVMKIRNRFEWDLYYSSVGTIFSRHSVSDASSFFQYIHLLLYGIGIGTEIQNVFVARTRKGYLFIYLIIKIDTSNNEIACFRETIGNLLQ